MTGASAPPRPSRRGAAGGARARAGSRRRRVALLGALTIAALLAVVAAVLGRSDNEVRPQVFPRAAAFWTPIPDAPRLDPDSARARELLAEPGAPLSLNVGLYGQPVYLADQDTPRRRVVVTREGADEGSWGRNALAERPVPIPDGAVPSAGSDGKLVVVDEQEGLVYDLWRAQEVDGQWYAEWGGVYPLDGDGSSRHPAYGEGPYSVDEGEPLSRGTGSGVSSLAGLLRVDELAAGDVDHALVFVTDAACGPPQTGPYRWPATTTDGVVTDQACVPQGARLQLDPSLDLDALDLTPVERSVAEALQTYGAYAVDIGGTRFGIVTESPRTDEQVATMRELGLDGDYGYLDGIPTDRFRLLASWDGS